MPSTPFTSCSTGVATDCSTATAEAPGKVAVTRMVGGARKGYCSKLSPRRLLRPSRTVMIEMTMATMGRRMKKLAMALVRLPGRRRRSDGRRGRRGGDGLLDRGGDGRDLRPRPHLLHSLHDDAVARP